MGGGAAGGGGAGGAADIVTVVFGAQRLSLIASLPVEKSSVHEAVGEQLSWAQGSLGLYSAAAGGTVASRRKLQSSAGTSACDLDNLSDCVTEESDVWEGPFDTLLDTLATLAAGLVLALLAQLIAHLAWKHVVNRKYYRTKNARKEAGDHLGISQELLGNS